MRCRIGLVIPVPDIVLIHHARLLDESAVAAAATVSSKLSARSAELENAGFKPFGSITAAGFFACGRKGLKDWRRGSESNRRIKVLQTSPLPLGYRALNVSAPHVLALRA